MKRNDQAALVDLLLQRLAKTYQISPSLLASIQAQQVPNAPVLPTLANVGNVNAAATATAMKNTVADASVKLNENFKKFGAAFGLKK